MLPCLRPRRPLDRVVGVLERSAQLSVLRLQQGGVIEGSILLGGPGLARWRRYASARASGHLALAAYDPSEGDAQVSARGLSLYSSPLYRVPGVRARI